MAQSRLTSIASLESTIASLEQNLRQLKNDLETLKAQDRDQQASVQDVVPDLTDNTLDGNQITPPSLGLEEYRRYGRQMILPGFGLPGQLKLKHAKVLIVGAGGLGCPAAVYLAGAGIGTIGLVDGDTVELSNLHRQIIHASDKIGTKKVESATSYLRRLNPKPAYIEHPYHLTPTNALDVFHNYDVILDCTDHPTSRYLISDAAQLCRKMLITASATKTDGQLMSLCHNWDNQPCYRCIFPKPPSSENVQSCSESGILGPAVGVMGTLMAVEAIKHIMQFGAYNPDGEFYWESSPALTPTLLLYSAFENVPFRTTYRTKQRKDCALCSSNPSITRQSLESGSMDYEVFCGVRVPINILPDHQRISAQTFNDQVRNGSKCITLDDEKESPCKSTSNKSYILLDVREPQDFAMCSIAGSVNLPFSLIQKAKAKQDPEQRAEPSDKPETDPLRKLQGLLHDIPHVNKYFVCRYGNDSQLAVRYFLDLLDEGKRKSASVDEEDGMAEDNRVIWDIEGGLRAWSKVDPTFPEY